MRRLAVFGATGSIGRLTLDLVARRSDLQVSVLSGGRNVALLAAFAQRHRAECVVTAFDDCYLPLKEALSGTGIAVAAGPRALVEAAHIPVDWTMSGIVGAAGLAPGFSALAQGKILALANKESLVAAGPLLLAEAKRHKATILPVDSEHSAVFQVLSGQPREALEKVILTASGGALRDWPLERLAEATPEQAAQHPNWRMGLRITIDSASMFNKAMEMIEARELFALSPEQVAVVIHPQSIVHALVAFRDGAMLAHLGVPDMRHAIGYALNWPERAELPVERLDLTRIGRLEFQEPDLARWPALRLAQQVMTTGGAAGAVFTAAKEVALDAFLARRIGFLDMAGVVEATLVRYDSCRSLARGPESLTEVLAIDAEARRLAVAEAARIASAPRVFC